jgi:hypothetical protein
MSQSQKRAGYFLLLAVPALTLRLLLVLRGHNQDLESYHEFAASPFFTNFYHQPYSIPANWSPALYWLFQIFYRLPGGHSLPTFHLYLATFYSLCDLFSAFVLLRTFGLFSAALFLFTPAEIIIAGYHTNAEPAVIACILAALYFSTQTQSPRKNNLFYLFIGLSLAIKHAFIFLPLWLAMQPNPKRERLKSLLIPYGIWLLILLPYLIPNPTPWIKNSLLYSSFTNNGLIPRAIMKLLTLFGFQTTHIPPQIWLPLFILPLLYIGYLSRHTTRQHLLLLYAPALVGLSSAIALQYLALPSYSFAAHPSIVTWLYNLFTLYQFGGHPQELHLYDLPAKLKLNFNNPGWHFLQLLCLIWVYQQIRKHRGSKNGMHFVNN